MGRHTAAGSRRAGTGSRRLRALLAGGLVLGVGATLTLAAWNDSEYATGSFQAGVFDTESNAGSGWASNTAPPGATLAFAGTGMSPNTHRYAHLDIRTTATTNLAGTVTLNSSTKSGDLADALEYRAALIPAATTCNAAAFSGSPTWVAGGAASYLAGGTMPGSTPSTPVAAAASETLRYCFDVRLPAGASNALQGTSGTLTWGFAAASNE